MPSMHEDLPSPLSRTGQASRQAPRLAIYDEQTEARGIEGTCLKTRAKEVILTPHLGRCLKINKDMGRHTLSLPQG